MAAGPPLPEGAPRPVSVVQVEAPPEPAPEQPPQPQQAQQQQQQPAPATTPGDEQQPALPPPEQPALPAPVVRSFASTEAQTESLQLLAASECELRDARRRERRMHRQRRRAIQRANGAAAAAAAAAAAVSAPPGALPPPSYQVPGACGVAGQPPGIPGLGPVGGFLHPPPPHLGLRGLSLGLPFPVPASVSAFGR